MKRIVLVAVIVLLAIGGITATAWRWPRGAGSASNVLVLPGTVEAYEVDLSFQVRGRIERLTVDEGDVVEQGQTVAYLDRRNFELSLRGAEARAAAARATLAALEAGTRAQEIQVAQARLASAKADLNFARVDAKRIAALVPGKLTTLQQLDQARLQEDRDSSRVAELEQTLALLREGPRTEDLERARAEYQANLVSTDGARLELEYTALVSPAAGVISVRLAEVGEVVASGEAVLRLAELSRPWVRAYLNTLDLPKVRLGQDASVRADGLPDKVFPGRLSFISPKAEFTPKTVETRALRVELVFRIKIAASNPEGLLKLGMPVDVMLPLVASH